MPHVTFVPLTGVRVARPELLELGLTLPGLRKRGAAIASLPSLGLLTLAGMTPERFTCSFHESDGRSSEELIEEVSLRRPMLVVISALTASAREAYRLGDDLKRRGLPTVFGGLHATSCAEEAAAHFDAVVIGDGEPVWHEVLRDAEQGSLKRFYRSGTRYDLSQSPVPNWGLLEGRARPRFTLQTQRGCPLACEFCAASRLLGRFREKPVENIRRELETIRGYDPHPVVELADDNTFAGARDVDELFDALEGSGARWFTEADWRIGTRPEILRRMASSGCVQVLVGIESMVEEYRGMGTKRAEHGRIMDALCAVQEAGVAVIGCFVVGADGETRESIDTLAQYLDGCDLTDVQLTVQTPFPGTALRDRLAREGRILQDRGWDHYTLFDVTYQPDRMSVRDLETSFQELARWTYRCEATRRREAIRKRAWQNHPRRNGLRSLRWHDSSSDREKPS